jgi:hypothetical protein
MAASLFAPQGSPRVAFHVPTKPFTAIDAINRVHVATGSPRLAMAGESADFNGHANHIDFNWYRGYYVGEYHWAGRNVWYRGGSLASAIEAGIREYDQQGKGASLSVLVEKDADLAVARAHPRLVEGTEDVTKADWWTWQHAHAGDFVRADKMFGGMDATVFLAAASYDDWWAKVTAELDRRRGNGSHVVRDLVKLD